MPDHVDLGLAVVVGAVAGVGGYVMAGAFIAVHLAGVYAVLTWLFVNYRAEIPDSDTWEVNRWNGLLTLVTILGAFAAINEGTVGGGLGFVLAGLVFGVGYTGFLVAVAMLQDARTGETKTNVEPNAETENA